MECRPGCGACCIAPSINTPLPGMPNGKPAGVPCAHLLDDMRCELFGRPERPALCARFQPDTEVCGSSRENAIWLISELEAATS